MHYPPVKSINTLMGAFLCLALTIATPALAQLGRYNPPQGGTSPISGRAGGGRGSCTGEAIPLTSFTALAPYSQVGQTSATHPTFAWYVPEQQSLTIDFRLYVFNPEGKLRAQPVYQTTLNSAPGIMTLTLPQSEPGLEIGERYLWQAALICDPSHGSEDLITNAEIQVVARTLPESERWYDLLKTTLDAASLQALSELFKQLAAFEQSSAEELARSASTKPEGDRAPLLERSKVVLAHSQNLVRIAEAER